MSSGDVHVYPTGDIIEHDTSGGDCLCGPTSEPVKRDDGSMGWVILHHSFDGREFTEPDHTGHPMPTDPS